MVKATPPFSSIAVARVALDIAEALKRLQDDKNDDQDHQDSRDLVEDTKETRRSMIFVSGKNFDAPRKITVETAQSNRQHEFHLQPGRLPISRHIRKNRPRDEHDDHG